MPGVCVSLIGFSLVFTGVMIMGINSTLKDSSGKEIRIAGPTCLTIGGLMVLGGFTAQYMLHKKYKERLHRVKKSRERITKSIAVISGSGYGSAAKKYLADGTVDTPLPSTSHGIPPSITVETILAEEEFYAQRHLDAKRRRDDVSDGEFFNFVPQDFSFDDSSDDDACAAPRQTQTEAVIEHRRRSVDSDSKKESLHVVLGKSRTPSTSSVRESVEDESVPDETITIRRSREIVHVSSPRPADGVEERHPITNGRRQNDADRIPMGSDEESVGDGSRTSATDTSDSSVSSQSSIHSSDNPEPARGCRRSNSCTENDGRARSCSTDKRPKSSSETRPSSQRLWRRDGIDSNHDNQMTDKTNVRKSPSDRTLKPPTPAGLLSTSWLASSNDEGSLSFVESLSRSSSFKGHEMPSIEQPTQHPENGPSTDLASLADSPSLRDSWSLADSEEETPNESFDDPDKVVAFSNHVDLDLSDDNECLKEASLFNGKKSPNTSPERISNISTPNHVDEKIHNEGIHHVNTLDVVWVENGDVSPRGVLHPHKSKGKMTKHSKCKNPRTSEKVANFDGDVISDYAHSDGNF